MTSSTPQSPSAVPEAALCAPGPGYDGYPQVLPTAGGDPMTVVVDARTPAAYWRLWGMSLLERNVRLVERLGAQRIHVVAAAEGAVAASQRRFPPSGVADVVVVECSPKAPLPDLADRGPVMVLQADAVYDRRLVRALWQCPAPAVLQGSPDDGNGKALLLLAEGGAQPPDWQGEVKRLLEDQATCRLTPDLVNASVHGLRKALTPRVIRVTDSTSLRSADSFLRSLGGKGVNDLMAEFVHPPIEFFLTRLVSSTTTLTPNQISWFNAFLSVAGISLIATGWLWGGIACNLVRGVTDGVDGKLARLTLRESTGGDGIDHVVDRVYMPAFFLALGFDLGAGDLQSHAALLSYGALLLYTGNRILAWAFTRLVGVSSAEHRPIDRLVRRIWPKRNICVLLLTLATLSGRPLLGLEAMVGLTGFMLLFRSLRLAFEALRLRLS